MIEVILGFTEIEKITIVGNLNGHVGKGKHKIEW